MCPSGWPGNSLNTGNRQLPRPEHQPSSVGAGAGGGTRGNPAVLTVPQWHPLQTHSQAGRLIEVDNVQVRQTQTFQLNHRLPEKPLAPAVLKRPCPCCSHVWLGSLEPGEAQSLRRARWL